jgi:hypothetical protein
MASKKKRAGNFGPTSPGFHGSKRQLTKAEMQQLLREAVENTPAVPEEKEDED